MSFEIQPVCSCFSCPSSILYNNTLLCARDIFKEAISIGKGMTVACEHSIEYFNRDTYESYERLKEKLDILKGSNLSKEVIVAKVKKSDPPSAKTVYDYINK